MISFCLLGHMGTLTVASASITLAGLVELNPKGALV